MLYSSYILESYGVHKRKKFLRTRNFLGFSHSHSYINLCENIQNLVELSAAVLPAKTKQSALKNSTKFV